MSAVFYIKTALIFLHNALVATACREEVVPRAGLEPATPAFSELCSTD